MSSLEIENSSTRDENFGIEEYYADTVGKNRQKIAEYIRHQLNEDKIGEHLTMFGKDDDPFKGGK